MAGKDGRFGGVILVKTPAWLCLQECDRANHLAGHQQRGREQRLGAELRQARIAIHVDIIDQQRLAFLHCFEGNRAISGMDLNTKKPFVPESIGLGAEQAAIGSSAPVINSFHLEESTRKAAEGADHLARVGASGSGMGEIEQEFLERLVRMRRRARRESRVSVLRVQSFRQPAKRLKIIGLPIEPTLRSQIESRKYKPVGVKL